MKGTGQLGNRVTLRLPAPAKLNLCLHVTARRADGYHELETLFQLLDFGDEIELQVTAQSGVRRIGDVAGVAEDDDLSVRAARLLAAHCDCSAGARIKVYKRLPMGGGLGGGSSNAASVLVGLNQLWKLGLNEDELAGLGLRLGADVPVFVRGHSAFARGIGEELQALSLPEQWFVVLRPPVHVETAVIFASPSLTRDTPHLKIAGFPGNLDTEDGLDSFWARTRNDCEPVVRTLHPPVAATLDWLAGHGPARMSGTGACVFARMRSREAAEEVLEALWMESDPHAGGKATGRLAPGGVEGFVARGVNRSPLVDAMQRAAQGRAQGDGCAAPDGA
ncbi:MAG: 4-diphosphocytidyl-2-C-methyl-D-erythritol kinase [Gammaproteobacteria bacterium]|jgi:4-diphosphocytidyl-2-C-methyl-D-erythritol kinase